MANTQASKGAGKYKGFKGKSELSSAKEFQSFASNIVEKVIKKNEKDKM